MNQDKYYILKFGGTSVSEPVGWRTMAALLQKYQGKQQKTLLVISALNGVTSKLRSIAAGLERDPRMQLLEDILTRHMELLAAFDLQPDDAFNRLVKSLRHVVETGALREWPAAETARLLAYGELLSSRLGHQVLAKLKMPADWLDARSLLVTIEQAEQGEKNHYLSAQCADTPDPALVQQLAGLTSVCITQGFIASDPLGETVLLGRGGSDLSAAYFAAKLSAEEIQIWTDVSGMFSADPRIVSGARLLQQVSYAEAQELAFMGAKVLHPRCIRPLQKQQIPISIHNTFDPEAVGTVIHAQAESGMPQVKGVMYRPQVTLISLESAGMWNQVGFLARLFKVFAQHHLSVDLISTSESNVTVTLDTVAEPASAEQLQNLADSLSEFCRVDIHLDCAAISLVGNQIRNTLSRISTSLDVFKERRVYLVSQSANDLNLTLVCEPEHTDQLVQSLHERLISTHADGNPVFGSSWEALYAPNTPTQQPWWSSAAESVLERLGDLPCAYMYSLQEVERSYSSLRKLDRVNRLLYSMKANSHPAILRKLHTLGCGFECVSLEEVSWVLEALPDIDPRQILYTPNFAPREEYQQVMDLGVTVTLDNLYILEHWAEDFTDQAVFIRLDLGVGFGHHEKVRTAGTQSKFGIPLYDQAKLTDLIGRHSIKVIGLHTHSGSGIFTTEAWERHIHLLSKCLVDFPDVKVLDLGGGLGVPERLGQPGVNLTLLNKALRSAPENIEIWLEPGRYLVAQSGVLLMRVTQTKGKGDAQYVGTTTGMNSIIRPMLYGAYHPIVNLTRLHEPALNTATVVGPICESGDVLGRDRVLPACREGDVLLMANAGAYGASMASSYNMREPAAALILDS